MGDQPYQDPFGSQLIQRCVIVQRDERGYGLTVSGDNPVFIQSVKDNGAAYKAGVQQGDRIIKVNGTLVTQSNHVEVVKMIRSGPYVALTLLGRAPGTNGPPLPSPHPGSSPTTNVTGKRPVITNPQPVDAEKGAEMRNERLNTYRNMLDKEKQLYEKIRTEYSVNPTEKLQKDLNGIQTRIRVLEQQLQKAYREGAYPKAVISMTSPTDNSEVALLGDEQVTDRNRRKSDSKQLCHGQPRHTRQRSTPETSHLLDDNHQTTAGLKRNNSDAQVKDVARQKLRRGAESRRTDRRTPDLDALGRSKSLPLVADGSNPDSDMGDSSPASTPPSQRRQIPEGMDGLEDLMNPSAAVNLQKASVGTLEDICPINPPQIQIISMEDDEFQSDNENVPDSLPHSMPASLEQHGRTTTIYNFDDHGLFNNFNDLEKKPAHMAVFMHYLISNSDPSSLFFYLVTDSYKGGNLKEMKKWVYEIFSTFLAPSAPLRIQVQDVVVQSIENITNNQRDNEDAMREVFHVARAAALAEIKDLLADFRTKRALGLGSIFGDQQLQADDMEKSRELKIVELTLLPHLERLTAMEAEKEAKNVAMAAALTTFLKNVGVRVQGNALERCPSFTARDKRGFLPSKKSTKKHVKGHFFQESHFYNTAFCNHCDGLLWGIGNQGYQCQHCAMTIHRTGTCFKDFQIPCQGKEKAWRRISLPKKEKNCEFTIHKTGPCLDNLEEHCQGSGSSGKKSKKITFTKRKRPDRTSTDKPKDEAVLSPTSPLGPGLHIVGPNKSLDDDEEISSIKSSGAVDNMIHKFDQIDDGGSRTSVCTDSGISGTESFGSADVVEGDENKYRKKNLLGRSESLKSKGEKSVKRKPSDSRRSRSDVDMDQQTLQTAIDASNASSSSSLSGRSQDSPSASIDSLVNRPIEEYPLEDSDMDADTDTPNWIDLVDKDMVKRLKPKEVKRQEVINELFYTEKSHVRTLKVLDRVFFQPLLREQVMPKEMVLAVFPNLPELLDVHMSLNNAMKKERRTSHIIQDIGDMLLKRFDGDGGTVIKRACATFCQNQKAALEMFNKAKEKKDGRLEKFITDAESNSLCQRLPFRALISTGFQRLTKYPLLIENLLKYSQSKTEEHKKLEKVRDCCKNLLAHVNTAIKECENQQILLEIAKKVDKGPLERSNNELVKEFKNLDLTSRKLIHHSSLVWRLSKTKNIELQSLLLEDILVLLQKQDDKYVLKCHSTTVPTMREDQKNTHSPIIKLNSVLCRPVATNKYAFFLVSTSAAGPQIYELVTLSKSDRETWMEHILAAQDIAKKRPSRRGGRVATVPRAVIAEEEEEKPGDVSPNEATKTTLPTSRPTDINRQNGLATTEANRKQKPEELEIALAESIRACNHDDMSPSYEMQKLPELTDSRDILEFMVTMSSRITPLLRNVHEKRTCSKVEDNIEKAVEIMEQKLVILQSLVISNESERLDLQGRCQGLQTENEELELEKERLQQELSASQHELLLLQESMQSMQQYRGEQAMVGAEANSYDSLPTTDIDKAEDDPSTDIVKSNRLSYSGESSSTTDSEENPDDTGYSQPVGATAATVTESKVQIEQPVRIVSNVVTELLPTKAHTAVELANDHLVSLHAGLDKMLHSRSNSSTSEHQTIANTNVDEECVSLGAPPPVPDEREGDKGSRTESVDDIEYGDSDMDEALQSIEPLQTVKTTQENVHEHTRTEQTPTVQMDKSESSIRHSPDIPFKDRGEGSISDNTSALRNNPEISTEGGGMVEGKACHIVVVDCNDQSSSIDLTLVGERTEDSTSAQQLIGKQNSEQTAVDTTSLLSLTTTPDTPNQNKPATTSDSPTSELNSSLLDPQASPTQTLPNQQPDDFPLKDELLPQDHFEDNLQEQEETLKLEEDAKMEKKEASKDGDSISKETAEPVQIEGDVPMKEKPNSQPRQEGSNQADPLHATNLEVGDGVEGEVEVELQSGTVPEAVPHLDSAQESVLQLEDIQHQDDLQPQPDSSSHNQPEPELV